MQRRGILNPNPKLAKQLLGVGAFDLARIMETEPDFLKEPVCALPQTLKEDVCAVPQTLLA